jgi:hypothetical protein
VRDRNSDIRKLIFLLIALAYGSFEILAALKDHSKIFGHVSEALFRVLTAGLLLYIADEILDLNRYQRQSIGWEDEFVRNNRNKLAVRLLNMLREESTSLLKGENNNLIVEPGWLAIASYEMFWRQLVEQSDHRSRLSVKIVHSVEMEVWSENPESVQLLNHQREFCNRGGHIKRILCGFKSRPTTEVIRAAEKMQNAGIQVLYYHIDPANQRIYNHDFSWDFAFITNTEEACVWDTGRTVGKPLAKIKRAEYFSGRKFRDQDLSKLFDKIEEFSQEINLIDGTRGDHSG